MSSSVASQADMLSGSITLPEIRTLLYVFEVSLEIKEDDGKVMEFYVKDSNCDC